MGRLKKEHDGWRTSGLWLKYQHPKINEVQKHKSKKDTNKWCRGKRGVQHVWIREQRKRYDWELDSYFGSYTTIKCESCSKRLYKRLSKVSHIPMRVFVEQYCEIYGVPVRRSDGTYSLVEIDHPMHLV